MTDTAAERAGRRLAKKRLDRLLVERELVETRQKAQALIMAGRVRVEGKKVEKGGTLVDPAAPVEVVGASLRYVGRGGFKLEAALQHFQWDVRSKVFLDIGSSTGGFVDCLLQHGAARVIAVDAGTNQLDWRLRQDPRIRLLERTNARYLEWEQIAETVDGITVDVSFISATMILPALVQFCKPGTWLLVLVKPQFEVGKGRVGRGGIVREESLHRETVDKVRRCAAALRFQPQEEFPCPILGASGNREFFLAARFVGSARQCDSTEQVTR
ncbi:MAG: TlyA family RNA methyltransferase [Acidobacteria bacterium]|nr:TlyA family RNA methyltransferase [Acidobacteriota bacterium]